MRSFDSSLVMTAPCLTGGGIVCPAVSFARSLRMNISADGTEFYY